MVGMGDMSEGLDATAETLGKSSPVILLVTAQEVGRLVSAMMTAMDQVAEHSTDASHAVGLLVARYAEVSAAAAESEAHFGCVMGSNRAPTSVGKALEGNCAAMRGCGGPLAEISKGVNDVKTHIIEAFVAAQRLFGELAVEELRISDAAEAQAGAMAALTDYRNATGA